MANARIVGILFLAFCVSMPASADQAADAYKRGQRAEKQNQYDAAYEAFSLAHSLKPKDARYYTAFSRLRFYAAIQHIKDGLSLREAGKLQQALLEFQRAAEIDHTNFVAKEEARRTEDMIRKQSQPQTAAPTQSPLAELAKDIAGPIELVPLSNTLINLRLSESSTTVYKTIAKLAGINVLFDPDYKPQKINIELNDVTLREALNVVAMQTKTFWQPTSSNTILVAADSPSKRKEVQDTVMKTFYLKNVSTTSELQEAANTLKGILELTHLQLLPNQNAIIVRGTTDQMVLAEKLLTDIDKPKPEVVIDIAVLQVSRNRIKTIGINPPTSASVSLVQSGSSSSSSSGWTLNSLRDLNATNFQVSVPGASMSMLMSDSDTKVIQNPQVRALDNEKATLKIGDRVPIATGSYGSSGSSSSTLVNTQFQYIDVGVNIDITPHIHADGEVTLKMTLEISSVSGTENIGGISEPIIGQRRIEHESRLQDGEVNLVGGILEDTETHSLSSYPWVSKIPVLKYLFAQDDRERQENEIVFAITPHIVRAQTVTDENLKLVDLGRGNSVSVHYNKAAKGDSNTPEARTGPTSTKAGHQVDSRPPARSSPPSGKPVSPQLPGEKGTSDASPPRSRVIAASAATAPTVLPVNQNALKTKQGSASSVEIAPPPGPAKADPCPEGQHFIGVENGVTNCGFN